MQITIYTETIWPSIHAALNHLQQQRVDNLSQQVAAGINFSIILGSACYLEGVLETGLKAILSHQSANKGKIEELEKRRSFNLFYNGLIEDIERRISNATGTDGYDPIFMLLVGKKLSQLKTVVPLWEGITVLFQVRNVLGHGRAVTAQKIDAYWVREGEDERFSGGYRRAEDYLRKKKLVHKRFFEAHSDYLFLSDAVADHFWKLAQVTPVAIAESLDGEAAAIFKRAVLS